MAGSPSIALFNLAANLQVRDDEEETALMLRKLAGDLFPSILGQVMELEKRYDLMRLEEKKNVVD